MVRNYASYVKDEVEVVQEVESSYITDHNDGNVEENVLEVLAQAQQESIVEVSEVPANILVQVFAKGDN